MNITIENQRQIDDLLKVLQKLLGDDLMNVSLYGSAIEGGLKRYSDIDLLVIVSRHTTQKEKQQLIQQILKISGKYMIDKVLRPIELTILALPDIKPWRYPPTFDFQYGEWLRNGFEDGEIEPWKSKTNTDITIVLKQAIDTSINIYGKPLDQIVDPVPIEDFIHACTDEVDTLIDDLELDTRNVLLTLCRIWYSLENEEITSKEKAIDWIMDKVDEQYRGILIHARNVYLGYEDENWSQYEGELHHCAELIKSQITAISIRPLI